MRRKRNALGTFLKFNHFESGIFKGGGAQRYPDESGQNVSPQMEPLRMNMLLQAVAADEGPLPVWRNPAHTFAKDFVLQWQAKAHDAAW